MSVAAPTIPASRPPSIARRIHDGIEPSRTIDRILHSRRLPNAMEERMAEPERVVVPDDRRDLPGGFRYRRPIEVRFGDTDAMGHVNNAAYLTFCEIARAGYYETVTGHHLPLATHGASESMILAEARITYRSPAFYGETLTIEARVGTVGRTSFTQEYRLTAPESRYGRARLVAVADSVQVIFDYVRECPIPVPDDLLAALEAFEGRSLRRVASRSSASDVAGRVPPRG
jgi:acyl-CoA thioester hydrolase